MSTNLREINGQATIVPDFDTAPSSSKPLTPEVNPNATRWIWQPLKDISLDGPNGLAKLFGKGDRFYRTIKRGLVYPLDDIWLMVTVPPDTNAGNVLDTETGGSRGPRRVRTVHTAYDCALEFKTTYEDLVGGVVFESLTGLTRDQASPIIEVVLPTIFNQLDRRGADKSGTWLGDLQGPAMERIKTAKLDDLTRARAERLRTEALIGMNIAVRVATDSRNMLIKSMAQASIGRNGQSQATPYDEAMAELLGLAVPTTIASESAQEGQAVAPSDRMLEFVLQTQERQTQYEEDMALMREEIAALRAERQQKARGGKSAPKATQDEPEADIEPTGDLA